jgi:hypothetical protein
LYTYLSKYFMAKSLGNMVLLAVVVMLAGMAAGAARASAQPLGNTVSPCALSCSDECSSLKFNNLDDTQIGAVPSSVAAALAAAVGTAGVGGEPMRSVITRMTAAAEAKADAAVKALTHDVYPTASLPNGTWETVRAGHWMSGFFSGVLWQLYELSGRTKPQWAEHARAWQAGLADKQREVRRG